MVIPHALLRIGGSLYTDESNWSVGIRLVPQDPLGGPVTDGIQKSLEDFRDAVRALNGTLVITPRMRAFLSTEGQLEYIRTSYVGADGRETAVAITNLAQPIPGTGQWQHDSQTCVCISLLSNLPGASNRGRFYWPALNADLDNTGRIVNGARDALVNEVAGWVADVGNSGDGFLVKMIPSIVSTTKGTARAIQSVRVGNRLDVQRRRADGQKESYGSALVAQ